MLFKTIILSFVVVSTLSLKASNNLVVIEEDNSSNSFIEENMQIQSTSPSIIVEESNDTIISTQEINNTDPNKITFLYIDSTHCQYCRELDKLLLQPEASEILEKHFVIKRKILNEDLELPKGLPLPYGTPTVYFLNSKNEALIAPMRGEKTLEELIEFLKEAIDEDKRLKKQEEKKSENLWEKALEE